MPAPPAVSAAEEELPEISEAAVQAMSLDERKKMALKLKEAGNKAYGAKDLDRAIDLYSKAILCRQDPVYYSNRAACYSALNDWEKVVEDTTAAINIDSEYIKALNRRANAYDHLGKYRESLLDFTASCIIDGFKNEGSAQAVERLLKKFAESEAKEMMASRPAKLPSPTFVGNYLQSFRAKPRPAGLDDAADLAEDTGKGQLRLGLQSLEKKTADGYEEASAAFTEALELDDLNEFEALAYNLRGTFLCLLGKHEEALAALTKSIELDPSMTQSYIKRASMNLELGKYPRPLVLFCFKCTRADVLQAPHPWPRTTSPRLSSRTAPTPTSSTTGRSFTLSNQSLPRPPRTTRSRLTWTAILSSRTSSSASHNTS